MICDSTIIKCLIKVYHYFSIKYQESLAHSLLGRFLNRIKNLVLESYIFSVCSREGKLSNLWYSSRFYILFFNWIDYIGNKLVNIAFLNSDYLKSSCLYRLLAVITRYLYAVIAASIFVLLIVPHESWNDIYIVIIVITLLLLFLCKRIIEKNTRISREINNVYFIIFFISIVFSEVFSISPRASLKFFLFYCSCFLIVFLLVNSINSLKELEQVIFIILIGVLIAGMTGVYQGFAGVPVKPSEVDLNLNQDMPGRVYSTFFNTNNFAEILAMLIPLGFSLFTNANSLKKKLLILFMLCPPFVSLLLTYSRSSWVGLAIAFFLMFLFLYRKWIPLFFILIFISIPFLPQSIYRRILTTTNFQDSSIKYRISIYRTLWPVIRNNWLSGIGTGTDTFKMMVQNYSLALLQNRVPPHSHNLILQIWLEDGLIGMLSFLGSILSVIKNGMKIFACNIDKKYKSIIISGISSIIGILVVCMAEYIWYYPRVMVVFWFVVGVTLTAINLARAEINKIQ